MFLGKVWNGGLERRSGSYVGSGPCSGPYKLTCCHMKLGHFSIALAESEESGTFCVQAEKKQANKWYQWKVQVWFSFLLFISSHPIAWILACLGCTRHVPGRRPDAGSVSSLLPSLQRDFFFQIPLGKFLGPPQKIQNMPHTHPPTKKTKKNKHTCSRGWGLTMF